MLKHIKQNLLILTMGLLSLALCLFLILELIPANLSGLEVSEVAHASSSLINKEDGTYSSAVVGRIYNPTDKTVVPEGLTVTVSNENGDLKEIAIQGQAIPPRTEWVYSQNWEGLIAYDRVVSVRVTVDGSSDLLPNSAATTQAGGLVLVYAALLLMTVGIFIRSCKIRYYLYQEDRMAEQKDEGNS